MVGHNCPTLLLWHSSHKQHVNMRCVLINLYLQNGLWLVVYQALSMPEEHTKKCGLGKRYIQPWFVLIPIHEYNFCCPIQHHDNKKLGVLIVNTGIFMTKRFDPCSKLTSWQYSVNQLQVHLSKLASSLCRGTQRSHSAQMGDWESGGLYKRGLKSAALLTLTDQAWCRIQSNDNMLPLMSNLQSRESVLFNVWAR